MEVVDAQEAAVAISEQAAAPNTRDAAELQADVESFDQVWETIRDRNWDPDFDLPAWVALRDKLRPKVESANSIDETRKILNELIQSLSKSHYGIIPSELYDKIKTVKEEKEEEKQNDSEDADDDEDELDGEAGLSLRLVEGRVLVTDVQPDGAAADAGVQPGWVLLNLKDQDLEELYDELREKLPPTSPIRPETLAALALQGKLEGDVGETVDLTFEDENDSQRQITLTYKHTVGNLIQFGHLPEMLVKSKAEIIGGDIGYVWFNTFFDPVTVMTDISTAVKAAEAGSGIILDLRGNLGGLAGMTMGVGNHFVRDKKSYLGTLTTKDTELKFVLIPRVRPYDGPVAVLIDECSISSAEILAGGLQAIDRARVFGVRSAGAALPSIVELLPNKDRFQFAFAGYTDSDGRNIEGAGVVPDEPVRPSREALLEGRDPILDAAVAWIHSPDKSVDNEDN
jgi:carboxyl-terminal processing protease